MKTSFLALAAVGLMLSARSTTHAQVTSDSGGATLTSSGSLTLVGGSTYTGVTQTNSGSLTLGSSLTYTGVTLTTVGTLVSAPAHTNPAFFAGQATLDAMRDIHYLAFANGNLFGYYSFLPGNPHYLYHYDMGFEYVFDANDGKQGIYLYDFKSDTFFYTSPTFPFPYLYDFRLRSVVYYFPDPSHPGHYNIDGTRWFYDFANGQSVAK